MASAEPGVTPAAPGSESASSRRRVGEPVDEAAEEPHHPVGLPAGRRPEVDPLEVEVAERLQRNSGWLGHADVAGPVDGVEDPEHERLDLV